MVSRENLCLRKLTRRRNGCRMTFRRSFCALMLINLIFGGGMGYNFRFDFWKKKHQKKKISAEKIDKKSTQEANKVIYQARMEFIADFATLLPSKPKPEKSQKNQNSGAEYRAKELKSLQALTKPVYKGKKLKIIDIRVFSKKQPKDKKKAKKDVKKDPKKKNAKKKGKVTQNKNKQPKRDKKVKETQKPKKAQEKKKSRKNEGKKTSKTDRKVRKVLKPKDHKKSQKVINNQKRRKKSGRVHHKAITHFRKKTKKDQKAEKKDLKKIKQIEQKTKNKIMKLAKDDKKDTTLEERLLKLLISSKKQPLTKNKILTLLTTHEKELAIRKQLMTALDKELQSSASSKPKIYKMLKKALKDKSKKSAIIQTLAAQEHNKERREYLLHLLAEDKALEKAQKELIKAIEEEKLKKAEREFELRKLIKEHISTQLGRSGLNYLIFHTKKRTKKGRKRRLGAIESLLSRFIQSKETRDKMLKLIEPEEILLRNQRTMLKKILESVVKSKDARKRLEKQLDPGFELTKNRLKKIEISLKQIIKGKDERSLFLDFLKLGKGGHGKGKNKKNAVLKILKKFEKNKKIYSCLQKLIKSRVDWSKARLVELLKQDIEKKKLEITLLQKFSKSKISKKEGEEIHDMVANNNKELIAKQEMLKILLKINSENLNKKIKEKLIVLLKGNKDSKKVEKCLSDLLSKYTSENQLKKFHQGRKKDKTAHKKIGPIREKFTKPSHPEVLQGIHTVKLHGNVRLEYFYANLYVGSPPQRQSVIVDIGSSLTAFPCNTCPYGHCGNHENPRFKLYESSTVAPVGCFTKFMNYYCSRCNYPGVAPNQPKHRHCQFEARYSENLQECLYGHEYIDVATLGDKDDNDDPKAPKTAKNHTEDGSDDEKVEKSKRMFKPVKLQFGCTENEPGQFKTQKANGIMGLYHESNTWRFKPNIVDALAAAKEIKSDTFSLCHGEEGGFFSLGGFNKNKHQKGAEVHTIGWNHYQNYQIKIKGFRVGSKTGPQDAVKGTSFTYFLDSGTTYIWLPAIIFDRLSAYMNSYCKAKAGRCKGINKYSTYDGTCMTYDRSKHGSYKSFVESYPVLYLELGAEGKPFEIAPKDYLSMKHKGRVSFAESCPAFRRSNGGRGLLGNQLMKYYDFYFDRKKKLMSYVRSNCDQDRYAQDWDTPAGQRVKEVKKAKIRHAGVTKSSKSGGGSNGDDLDKYKERDTEETAGE